MMNDNKYGRFDAGKIYVDAQGRRWRVVGFVTEPAVMLEDPDYDGTQHPSDPRPGFQVWTINSPLASELRPEVPRPSTDGELVALVNAYRKILTIPAGSPWRLANQNIFASLRNRIAELTCEDPETVQNHYEQTVS